MRIQASSVIVALLLVGKASLAGQPDQPVAPPTPTPSPSPTPAPKLAVGMQVQTGTLIEMKGSRSSSSYTRIIYNGKTLSEKGTAFKPTDATNVFSLDGSDRSDFSPDLKIDLFQGSGTTTNSTLNAYGIERLNLGKSLKTFGYQAVGRVATRLDGNQALLSGGIESAPLHLVTMPGLTNWLHLGAAGERFWQKRSLGKDESRGVLNYRAFFGKAEYRVNGERLKFKVDDILKKAPDLETFKTFLDSEAPDEVSKFLALWAEVYNSAATSEDQKEIDEKKAIEADYRQWIVNKALLENKQFGLAPSSALGLESEGWWTVAGDLTKRRASAIAALGYTKWFGVGNGGAFASSLQLRYELGYDRATPTTKVNRLLVSANLNF